MALVAHARADAADLAWTLYQYNLAGCAATNVLPARSGRPCASSWCAAMACRSRAHRVVVLEEILNAWCWR